MKERLSISLLQEWDLKVFKDPKYGNEQRLISEYLNRYKYNTDRRQDLYHRLDKFYTTE